MGLYLLICVCAHTDIPPLFCSPQKTISGTNKPISFAVGVVKLRVGPFKHLARVGVLLGLGESGCPFRPEASRGFLRGCESGCPFRLLAKQAAHTLASQCEKFDRAASYLKTRLVRSLFDGRDWLPVLPFSNGGQSIHVQSRPPRPPAGLATFPKQSVHGLPSTTRSSP